MVNIHQNNDHSMDAGWSKIYLFILETFTQDRLFSTNQTVINENPALVGTLTTETYGN